MSTVPPDDKSPAEDGGSLGVRAIQKLTGQTGGPAPENQRVAALVVGIAGIIALIVGLALIPAGQPLLSVILVALAFLLMAVALCVALLAASRAAQTVLVSLPQSSVSESTPLLEPTDHTIANLNGRQRALIGRWVGTLKQQFKGEWRSAAVEMDFRVDGKTIKGILTVDHPYGPSQPKIKLEVVNTNFHDPFFELSRRNIFEYVLQFGCWIAELSADGMKLEGRLVGYGSISNRIVFGEVSVSKAP